MRRAGVVLASIALAAAFAGCASVGHTWQDEFTARLEGAGTSVEETLTEVGSDASKAEDFQEYVNLGRELEHDGELLEGLDPPRGCTEVQVKGFDHIESVLARLEREAETCASG